MLAIKITPYREVHKLEWFTLDPLVSIGCVCVSTTTKKSCVIAQAVISTLCMY